MPDRNGDAPSAVRDAIRLMERVRSVPDSVRAHLVRDQRRRAVQRIVALRRKRNEPKP